MKVKELLIENELAKPQVRLVGSQLAAAGMDTSPEIIAQFSNVPIGLVKKYVSELERKRPLAQWVENHLDPLIHRVIATLFWYKNNQDNRSVENIELVSGLDYETFVNLFKHHYNEISKVIRVGIGALMARKTEWKDLSTGEKKQQITDAFTTLSKGTHGNVSSADASRYIVRKYNLKGDINSFRRQIDKMLETMPELEKYRVVGRSYRGPEETYPGIKVW